MQINHRIALNSSSPFWRAADSLGLSVDRSNSIIWVANITEDHPTWPAIEPLVAIYDPRHLVNTVFTASELDGAGYLRVLALGHHGYPEPAGDNGYFEATYDTAHYCHHCGQGLVQRAPFRFRSEPKASHSQFLQLNWVFDELFVRKLAQEGIANAGIAGVDFAAPVLHKNGRPLEQVAQMRIATMLPPGIDARNLKMETCAEPKTDRQQKGSDRILGDWRRGYPYCGRVWYAYFGRGPLIFRRQGFDGAPDVVKSHEYIGMSRAILVSQRFRRLVLDSKWRGVTFEPIELVG